MKNLFVMTALISMSISNVYAINLEGVYDCYYSYSTATDSTAKQPLKGIVTLKKSGDIYKSISSFENKQFVGTGIYDEKSKHLSLIWSLENKLDQVGLLSVDVNSESSFKGKWIFLGSNSVGTQTCYKKRSLGETP